MEETKNLFEDLYSINVTDKVEQKNGLNYLSWAYAWAEVKKRDEFANYEIIRFGEKENPYLYDDKLGYMVFTRMTIFNQTHEMWLPVMDGANKTMLDHPYTYQTKYGEKTVEQASMFDINKTLMRCLVKNIAMFGLGLALYTGEDLPEQEINTKEDAEKYVMTFGKHKGKTLKEIVETDDKYIKWLINSEKTDDIIKHCITLITGEVPMSKDEQDDILNKMMELSNLLDATNTDRDKFYGYYEVNSNQDMTLEQLNDGIEKLKRKLPKSLSPNDF